MSANPKVLTAKEQLVLGQLQQQHREIIANYRALDSKAESVTTVSSIIITLVSGFQLAGLHSAHREALWIILVLYAVTIFFAFRALFPQTLFHEPLRANWDDIRDSLRQEDDAFFYSLLSGYEDTIQHNRQAGADKARRVRLAFLALSITVGLTLLIAATI